MIDARSRQANQTRAGRWTVAAALLAGAMTVLAACGGATPEGSEPIIRGAVDTTASACTPTSTKPCAVAGTNPGEVLVSWIGSGTGFIVQYMKPGGGSYRNPSGSCNLASTTGSALLQCTATGVPEGTNKFRVATYRNGGAGTYSSLASVTVIGAPGAPAIGAAAATGQTTATVAFTAPTSTGGSPITTYTATSNPVGGTGTSSAAGSITVNGLTAGTAYTFTVTASNMARTSVPSGPSGSVTTFTSPSAPVIGAATVSDSTTARVAFTAPSSNGGSPITKYTATSIPGGTTGTLSQAGSGTIIVSGLTSGTAYKFTVTATNAAGDTSEPSGLSESVTPTSGVSAVAGTNSGEVVVTWTGVTGATGYSVAYQNNGTGSWYDPSSGGCTYTKAPYSTSTQCTASSLNLAVEYTFRVITVYWNSSTQSATYGSARYSNKVRPAGATASSSDSTSSSGSTATATVPSAPSIYLVDDAPGSTPGKAFVYFNPPTSNGGSTITGYTVTSSGGQTGTCSGAQCGPIIVEGLTGGRKYTFQMIATSTNGPSVASATSSDYTAKGVPDAPEIVSVVRNASGAATINFSAPFNNGGSPITSYTGKSTPGDQSVTVTAATVSSTGTTQVTFTGLTIGTQYTFTMQATNMYGDSVNSAGKPFTASS